MQRRSVDAIDMDFWKKRSRALRSNVRRERLLLVHAERRGASNPIRERDALPSKNDDSVRDGKRRKNERLLLRRLEENSLRTIGVVILVRERSCPLRERRKDERPLLRREIRGASNAVRVNHR